MGLEIAESFILCGLQAFKTRIKNIAMFMHKDDQVEVAQGQFTDKGGDTDITRLESGMSFLQVKTSMNMKEKLRQLRSPICVKRREITHTRLEAVAGADNPYSLITIFGRGHLAIKAWGAVCITICAPVKVIPCSHKNCTKEIPELSNGTEVFVDPISYVIKTSGLPAYCNDIAPPRYKVGGKWYCSYPELREWHDPPMLPVDEVRIEGLKMNYIGLGKSFYTKKQLDAFAAFQDSQGTRRSYLDETTELAYMGRKEKGERGLALGAQAQMSLMDLIGMSFIPLYSVVGPFILFFVSLLLMVWGSLRLVVTIFLRVAIMVRYRGCGMWVLTAFWGTLFQLADSPFNWINKVMEDVGKKVGKMLDKEAGRDHPKEAMDEPNLSGHQEEGPVTYSEKADLDDTISLFEGKNTRV